jgi:hypothetical protein
VATLLGRLLDGCAPTEHDDIGERHLGATDV